MTETKTVRNMIRRSSRDVLRRFYARRADDAFARYIDKSLTPRIFCAQSRKYCGNTPREKNESEKFDVDKQKLKNR